MMMPLTKQQQFRFSDGYVEEYGRGQFRKEIELYQKMNKADWNEELRTFLSKNDKNTLEKFHKEIILPTITQGTAR
jgi:hypothetical protein